MKDIMKQLLKIGVTVASVAITTACGGDEKLGFLIGSMVGGTAENISEQIEKSRNK